MSEIQAVFAKRLHDLRRLKGWSQPEVGKLIGTSGGPSLAAMSAAR